MKGIDSTFSPPESSLGFIRGGAAVSRSLSLFPELYGIIRTFPGLFIHSPTDGHLGSFQFFAIINKALWTFLYK